MVVGDFSETSNFTHTIGNICIELLFFWSVLTSNYSTGLRFFISPAPEAKRLCFSADFVGIIIIIIIIIIFFGSFLFWGNASHFSNLYMQFSSK